MNRREAIERTAVLLGYAVSAPAIAGLLQGCKPKPELNYKPVFLTAPQALTISEVSEIIIPKTETPGAKDVGVPAFIDSMLSDVYPKADQDRFLKGLDEFEAGAKKEYGTSFIELKPEQQIEWVKKVHDPAIEASKKGDVKDRPFILTVKELTLLGFFTSEPGATVVLHYEPVPGAYHGCLPLAEVGKTWAT
jgi:gluconate 2-dehydrogenase gamma chain